MAGRHVKFLSSVGLLLPVLAVLLEVVRGRKREAERRAFSAPGCAVSCSWADQRRASGQQHLSFVPVGEATCRVEAAVLARGTLLQRDGRCQQMDTAQVWEQFGKSKDEAHGRRTNEIEKQAQARARETGRAHLSGDLSGHHHDYMYRYMRSIYYVSS